MSTPRRNRIVPIVAATIAVVVIGVGLLVAFAARDEGDQSTSAASLPATSLPSTSVATSATVAADRPCPNPEAGYSNHCLGALEPGTYQTTTFEPSFTYTVPAGWWNTQDTPGNYLLLPPGESLSTFGVDQADFIGVFASVAAPAGCQEYPDPSVPSTVEGYVGWLRAQPTLVVSEPTPVVVGGLDGTQVDVALSDAAACVDPDSGEAYQPVLIGTNSSLLGYEPGKRSDRVDSDTRVRLVLFDRPNGELMVIELVDTDSIGDDSWWTTATEITDTLLFEP
jgi:hypothetical protein